MHLEVETGGVRGLRCESAKTKGSEPGSRDFTRGHFTLDFTKCQEICFTQVV